MVQFHVVYNICVPYNHPPGASSRILVSGSFSPDLDGQLFPVLVFWVPTTAAAAGGALGPLGAASPRTALRAAARSSGSAHGLNSDASRSLSFQRTPSRGLMPSGPGPAVVVTVTSGMPPPSAVSETADAAVPSLPQQAVMSATAEPSQVGRPEMDINCSSLIQCQECMNCT